MPESSGLEIEAEVKRSITEEKMDSSSLITLTETNSNSAVKPDFPKDVSPPKTDDFQASELESKKVCVEMDADKTPDECTNRTKDEKSGCADTACTQVEVNGIDSCVAQIDNTSLVDPASDSSTTAPEKTEIIHQESSDTVSLESVSGNVELMTEDNGIPESLLFIDYDTDNAESESNIQVLPIEKDDRSSTLPMDVADSVKKTDQKNIDDSCNSKDEYRRTVEISDSDSDSDDTDSSSVSSLSSPSKSGSGSDSDIECVSIPGKTKKGSYPVIKAKGELLPEDLPPIEELHISVPSSLCAEIGVVTSIVKTLVVIQSHQGVPALDLDSVLFLDSGSRALGLVFDVFGPVTEPLYCVRFNSAEQIAEFNVNPGDKVYYAPRSEHSKYVFLQQLMRMKGSDATNHLDLERRVQVEYSDDEEERQAYERHGDEIAAEEEGLDLDQLKRKRDPNEVLENKKKFAPQFPPRNQRNGLTNDFTRPQMGRRAGPPQRQVQRQQYRPPRQHNGPIHPPSFSFPPPSIPGPSMPRINTPIPGNTYPSYALPQGLYNNQLYQNPSQPNPSFGQLPYAQPQLDPRIAQFGAQFAQMVCNLQSSTSAVPVNVPPPAVPSFNVPYNQPLYSGSQNSYNAFYKPPPQGPPATYSAPPFSSPPPMHPPGQPPIPPNHNTLPNQNATFGGQYTSTYSSYPNQR